MSRGSNRVLKSFPYVIWLELGKMCSVVPARIYKYNTEIKLDWSPFKESRVVLSLENISKDIKITIERFDSPGSEVIWSRSDIDRSKVEIFIRGLGKDPRKMFFPSIEFGEEVLLDSVFCKDEQSVLETIKHFVKILGEYRNFTEEKKKRYLKTKLIRNKKLIEGGYWKGQDIVNKWLKVIEKFEQENGPL